MKGGNKEGNTTIGQNSPPNINIITKPPILNPESSSPLGEIGIVIIMGGMSHKLVPYCSIFQLTGIQQH